jgi:hypothetical protein
VVDLPEVSTWINLNPLGPVDGTENVLADKNVTSLAVEVPIACLKAGQDPVIGAWTTASAARRSAFDPNLTTLSAGVAARCTAGERGRDRPEGKDRFNGSEPKNDWQFATYVTNPTLPVLINALFGVPAPAPRRATISCRCS